jgi:hypothetical protein
MAIGRVRHSAKRAQDFKWSHGTQRSKKLKTQTLIYRTGAGSGRGKVYTAMSCVLGRRSKLEKGDERCGYGSGRTPTMAIKKSLHRLATKLK